MTKSPGIPKQCVIQMDYLNELMEEWLYRQDETLLLNVNPWSAAQLCNIYDQRQKKAIHGHSRRLGMEFITIQKLAFP